MRHYLPLWLKRLLFLDDSPYLQRLVDQGKPLPAGTYFLRKPIRFGNGNVILGTLTACDTLRIF